jgi:hypothetical protein
VPGRRDCQPPTTGRLGHQVTVHEAGPLPGGMMRFGIPQYRLPREVLDAEVQRIVDLGVQIEYNTKVSDVLEASNRAALTPCFWRLAPTLPSAPTSRLATRPRCSMPCRCCAPWKGEDKPMLGRRVVVYGGGNTAIDVARTAKRLGATEAIIVYRRNREKMPAHDFEVEEALQEGVMIKWLSTITQAGESSITVEKMALDEKAFRSHRRVRNAGGRLGGAGLGQDVDLSLIEGVPGLVREDGVVRSMPT